MKKYFMAIDAGTGSIRAVIFDELFNQVAVSQKEWFHKEDNRFKGAIDFDVKENYKLMLETIIESLASSKINPKEVVSISTTSMREAFVLYDSNNEEIWAVSNVDSRANKEVFDLKSMDEAIESKVYNATGQTFALSAIPRLIWVKNNLPEIYSKTSMFTMLNDWLAFKLTGKFSMECSNGSTSGLINIHTRQFDLDLIRKFGLKDNIYPTIYDSGSVLSNISSDISHLTGLSEDCIVVVGGGDVQMGCLGIGSVNPNQVSLFGGSFWQLEYNSAGVFIDSEIRTRINCHAQKNLSQQELIAFYPGLTLRWFRDSFCRYEKSLALERGVSTYEVLNELAESVPVGSNGMLCSFSSVMNYSDWKHPSPCFTNFNINSDLYNIGTFYRCLLENAALVTLGHKKIIENLTGSFPDEITFASGASSSPLWCQIVADVLNVKVSVPVIKEATALGAAFSAAIGFGAISDFNEAADKYVKTECIYFPNEENNILYEEIYKNWLTLSHSQTQHSEHSVLNYMWKAPGL